MEDKTNDENLDLLFTGSIDPVETEPSDRFWRRASEEMLKRENSGYRRKVFAWRSAALFFATIVVLLSAYTFYIQTKVNTIEEKIAVMEKQQTIKGSRNDDKSGSKSNNATGVSINDKQKTTSDLQNDNNTALVINNAAATSINNLSNKVVENKIKTLSLASSNDIVVRSNVNGDNLFVSPENATGNGVADTAGTNLAHADSVISYRAIKDTSTANKKFDSSNAASIADIKQDVVPDPVKPSKAKDTRTLKERLYVSAFFAPKIEDDFLSGDDESSQTTSKDVKTRETDQLAFSTGLRLGYNVSSHWSIFTGFYYHSSSFSVKPVLIAAQQQEGRQVGYSITTSSGVVDFTDVDLQPKVGDSIKASVQSSRNYISIPLQLRYDFTSGHRLGFYVTGGMAINFAYNNTTEIHWENTGLQEGDILIRTIPDLNNVQYSYTLAGGVKYLLIKHLSVFVEPSFQGSFAAINKSAPIKAYPLLFGLSAGLTYHF